MGVRTEDERLTNSITDKALRDARQHLYTDWSTHQRGSLRAQHDSSTQQAAWTKGRLDERDDATVVSGSRPEGTLTEVRRGAV